MSTKSITMAAAGVPTGPTDPNFKQVTLLLTGDGTNGAQNNTFLDSSSNNFTITRNGNTTQGTFSPFSVGARYWSNYFDGSGPSSPDYLRLNNTIGIANNAFTIGFWFYPLNNSVIGLFDSGPGVANCFRNYPANSIQDQNDGTVSFSGSYNVNAWNWMCITKSGTSFTVYINGTTIGSATCSSAMTETTFTIGAINSGGDGTFLGYISNFIVINNAATILSVPTSPLTAVSGTSLLTCQSNRFLDNSTNNFTITRFGDVRVTPFSPLAPTAAYDPAVNGGSGYFDGSGGYLLTPNTGQFTAAGDLCISFWTYLNSLPNAFSFIGQWFDGTNDEWLVQGFSDGSMRLLTAQGFDPTATGLLRTGIWNYIAVIRSGSTLSLFLNGTQIQSYTKTGTFGSLTKRIYIGINRSLNQPINGYMSNIRLVSGTVASGQVPPTAPLTSISGTNLLLNFTNAGIFDSSGKNDLETVGNAQVSTAVKQFGTGSIVINTSTDGCAIASSLNVDFGTGNWTIEGWFYTGQSGASKQVLVMNLNQTTGMSMCVSTSSVEFRSNGQTDISGSGVSSNTWTYIAWVRNGNTVTIYKNGTSIASGTYTNVMGPSNFYVGPTGGLSGVSASFAFTGYIDDLRITKGVARYTSNFTPPTAAFPLK